MNALVRVRLLAFVCRLWGLAGPLVMGPAAQAKEGVPPSCGNGGNECDQKHEAASGATLCHQSYFAVGDTAFTSALCVVGDNACIQPFYCGGGLYTQVHTKGRIFGESCLRRTIAGPRGTLLGPVALSLPYI